MTLIIVVKKYGLKNIVRKIMGGALLFSVLHGIAFWYAKYQTGGVQSFAALERKFLNFNSSWDVVVSVLSFPIGLIEASETGYYGLMIVNSLIWGLLLSLFIVPIFIKK